MRFLIFVCPDTTPVEANSEAGMNIEQWVAKYDASGVRLLGDRLAAASDARAVRVRDGKIVVQEGPFIESAQSIGGFDVLECRDLAEAIEVAAVHPMARAGVIEIRPFWNG